MDDERSGRIVCFYCETNTYPEANLHLHLLTHIPWWIRLKVRFQSWRIAQQEEKQ